VEDGDGRGIEDSIGEGVEEGIEESVEEGVEEGVEEDDMEDDIGGAEDDDGEEGFDLCEILLMDTGEQVGLLINCVSMLINDCVGMNRL
jgi:hypothetical protein